ncbi:hypothetical protein VTO42DRAFT_1892 [Malbranchea cinnamomea]
MPSFWKICSILAVGLTTPIYAHMRLFYPPPFAAENNPHRTDPPDERLDYPYNCCGEENTPFPCRGHLSLLGTDQGSPVAVWEAGSVQNFSLIGQGTHWGGSCQAGFSIDGGQSWKVVASYEGNCPHRDAGPADPAGQTFEFTVPADMPAGDHVFAWTWINREQEFFMSCSPVTITRNDSAEDAPQSTGATAPSPTEEADECISPDVTHPAHLHVGFPARRAHHPRSAPPRQPKSNPEPNPKRSAPVPFHERPNFLVANIGNGCTTSQEAAEVKFPNPGPDVVEGDGEYPLELPEPAEKCNP